MANSCSWALVIAVLVVFTPAAAGAQVADWWSSSPSDETRETGDLSEITGRRVFLDVTFTTPDLSLPQEVEVIRQYVLQAIRRAHVLEVVTVPEGADFAISIVGGRVAAGSAAVHALNYTAAIDETFETPISVSVLVPGAARRDGSRRPRVVWELSSANVRGDPAPAAGFAVECFIGQLKKMRQEK